MRGFDKPSGKFPALRQHDPNQIAGYVETTEAAGGGVRLKGRLSASTEAGREVAALSDECFPWQASLGYPMSVRSTLLPGFQAMTVYLKTVSTNIGTPEDLNPRLVNMCYTFASNCKG
jgi:hypothetical protein